jgi:hypothetical protein
LRKQKVYRKKLKGIEEKSLVRLVQKGIFKEAKEILRFSCLFKNKRSASRGILFFGVLDETGNGQSQ